MIKLLYLQIYSEDFSQLNEIIKSWSSAKRYAFCRYNKDKLNRSDVRRKTVDKYINYFTMNRRYIDGACFEAQMIYEAHISCNKLKDEEDRIDEKTEEFKTIFGSRKEFKRYKNGTITKEEFILRRDNQLFCHGEKERKGNQNLRILGNKLRVTIGNKHNYVYYDLFCPQKYKKDLHNLLQSGQFYNVRLLRQDKTHFEVQVQYILPNPIPDYIPTNAVGIDTNPMEIALTTVSLDGNYIDTKTNLTEKLLYSSKNKKQQQTVIEAKKIVLDAKDNKSMIVFENLKFESKKKKKIKKKANNNKRRVKKNKNKAKEKKLSKKHNRLLSNFNSSQFIKLLEQECTKHGVPYVKIHPAYTSIIARLKYKPIFNRRIHNVAAYVIARRGLGFKEKLSLNGYNKVLLKEVLLGTLEGKYKKKHFSSWKLWQWLSDKEKAVLTGLLTQMLVLKETSDCTRLVDRYLDSLDELDVVQVKNDSENLSGKIFQLEQVVGSSIGSDTSVNVAARPQYKSDVKSI